MKLVAAVVGLVGLGATAGFASSSFTDVEQDRYYTDAVDWAFDNGVTTGTSATTFSPEDPATRAQSVTFLHRYDENVVQPALDDLTSDIAGLDTLDELSCEATQVVIYDDGWVCATLRLTRSGQFPPGVNRTFVAESGVNTSVAIGLDGNPIISYLDWATDALNLHVCGDPVCTSGTNRTLVDVGSPGNGASMALNADGNPVIAHFESDLDDLRLYVCDDPACASGTDRKLADVGSGAVTSVVVSADNNPVIAYVDDFADNLMLYMCGDSACTFGTNRRIRNGGGPAVGDFTSVALGADGNPIIAHLDTWNDGTNISGLDLYVCGDAACTFGTNQRLADNSGDTFRLVVGADGNPIIAHIDTWNDGTNISGLDLYVCGDAACTFGTNQELMDVDGIEPSLVEDSDGNPIITYYDEGEKDLRMYACADRSCTTGASHSLDAQGDVGSNSSMAIGADGNPVVSYYDADNQFLKVTRAYFGVTGIIFE